MEETQDYSSSSKRGMKEEGVKRRQNMKEGMREGLNKPRD